MGNFIKPFFALSPPRILLLGLDGAGKTSILYKLQINQTIQTIPTIGFNVEELDYNGTKLCMWDLGGQKQVRTLWKHYFSKSQALVFVVDSADSDRMEECKEELLSVINDPLLTKAKILIFANKQDLGESLKSREKLETALGLKEIKQVWNLQLCSAVTGEGLKEGLDWLSKNLW